jgi:hypothetical protein
MEYILFVEQRIRCFMYGYRPGTIQNSDPNLRCLRDWTSGPSWEKIIRSDCIAEHRQCGKTIPSENPDIGLPYVKRA